MHLSSISFGQEPSRETFDELTRSNSDEMIIYPLLAAVNQMRSVNNETYFYKYNYRGLQTFTEMTGYKGEKDLGVSHFDELLLLFTNKASFLVMSPYIR